MVSSSPTTLMVLARSRRISSTKKELFLQWIFSKFNIIKKKNLRIIKRIKKIKNDEVKLGEENKKILIEKKVWRNRSFKTTIYAQKMIDWKAIIRPRGSF